MNLDFIDVCFHYPSQADLVFSGLNMRIGRAFTGVAGANGSGKTTLLLLACGMLRPTSGQVRVPGSAFYCPQRTDHQPEDLPQLLETPDRLAAQLVGRLGLCPSWSQRWDTLSHGERKRAQIACALWRQADVLAIDEPTNHVDAATRHFLITALRQYRGIGLLVSHDRQLLDELCSNCLMFEHGTAVLRSGSYSRLLGVLETLIVCLAFPVGWLSVLGAGVSDPPLAAVVFVPLNGYFWGFLLEWLYRVWQQSRRQKRQQLGLCLQCGYDLRASMDRCPECGTPIREEVTSEQPQ